MRDQFEDKIILIEEPLALNANVRIINFSFSGIADWTIFFFLFNTYKFEVQPINNV